MEKRISQIKLAEGNSDKSNDCRYCFFGSTKKNNRDMCSPMEDVGFHRCERCGHCSGFRPITSDDAVNIQMEKGINVESERFPLVRISLNRWKWRKKK